MGGGGGVQTPWVRAYSGAFPPPSSFSYLHESVEVGVEATLQGATVLVVRQCLCAQDPAIAISTPHLPPPPNQHTPKKANNSVAPSPTYFPTPQLTSWLRAATSGSMADAKAPLVAASAPSTLLVWAQQRLSRPRQCWVLSPRPPSASLMDEAGPRPRVGLLVQATRGTAKVLSRVVGCRPSREVAAAAAAENPSVKAPSSWATRVSNENLSQRQGGRREAKARGCLEGDERGQAGRGGGVKQRQGVVGAEARGWWEGEGRGEAGMV
jgi:hypothetical protein